ncbi:MAG: hypothetical protein PHW76_08840 [Alphaproteobacteria bacterium]|nr:hypothetical protein [Alphaproteobacteria bacterium]
MIDFKTYLDRHGEVGVQAILETIERTEGIRYEYPVQLEFRWNRVMAEEALQERETPLAA